MTTVSAKILYEDNHLIIINKAPGDIVQGDETGDKPLLDEVKDYIKKKHKKPGDVFLGLVHRIDRPVSGIVIFARTSKALARMNELFQTRQITKKYLAVTRFKPPENQATLTHYLIKNNYKNKSNVYVNEKKGASKAVLEYALIAQSDSFYLLEVNLHTGRHHQIRAQMAAIGCPIKGDLKYGDKRSNDDGSISLHAAFISFLHPVSKESITISAPAPDNKVWNFFGL